MTTTTKPAGQVKRLVLNIGGTKLVLDPSITREEALTIVDILAKGAKEQNYVYVGAPVHGEAQYAEGDVDISLRVTVAVIHESRAAAQEAADAAVADAKEVAQ